MTLKEVVAELMPFAIREPIVERRDGTYGSVLHCWIVARNGNDDAIDPETLSPCAEGDTWELHCPFELSKKRYHYLKRKGRDLQRDQELQAEQQLALYDMAKRLVHARTLLEAKGIRIIPVPARVEEPHDPE